jgi:hypothetical protein
MLNDSKVLATREKVSDGGYKFRNRRRYFLQSSPSKQYGQLVAKQMSIASQVSKQK